MPEIIFGSCPCKTDEFAEYFIRNFKAVELLERSRRNKGSRPGKTCAFVFKLLRRRLFKFAFLNNQADLVNSPDQRIRHSAAFERPERHIKKKENARLIIVFTGDISCCLEEIAAVHHGCHIRPQSFKVLFNLRIAQYI